jgi:hypothetical protein
MRKQYTRLVLFPVLLIFILISAVYITTFLVKSRDFKINETDSNTLVMKQNQHFDMLLTGASHARNFSRHQNNDRVEAILNKSITNIAQGAATCGVAEQYFYFKYFIEENNSVDQLIYILSPPFVYAETLPIASNTFNQECFSFKFLFRYLKFDADNKRQRIFEYIRSKLTWAWIDLQPSRDEAMLDVLEKVDSAAIQEGLLMYYGETASQDRFKQSCNIIEDEINFALDHQTETVFIIPPAAFGKWPQHEDLLSFLREMNEKYGCQYFDFSESLMEPQYYYDHHHLNTAGVVYFTENFLKPAFNNQDH